MSDASIESGPKGPFGDPAPSVTDNVNPSKRAAAQTKIGRALGRDMKAEVSSKLASSRRTSRESADANLDAFPHDYDPEPGSPNENGEPPGAWIPNRLGLPDDFPITPLGYDGDTFYFLTWRGTVSYLSGRDCSEGRIESLFAGRTKYLAWCFAAKGKRDASRWDVKEARRTLFDAAQLKGAWDPMDKIRGRGAWTNEFGDIIWHAGDALFVQGEKEAIGEYGFYLYPSRPRLPKPAARPVPEGPRNAAGLLLDTLQTWNWDKDYYADLTLAWIGQSFIGGALNWRSNMLITGKTGAGKSTFQGVLRNTMQGALFASADATAAGVYQALKSDSIAVSIDEFEGKNDDRRNQAILELARAGNSGDKFHRGGADHKGVEYTVRSAFCLTGISPPALSSQDKTRFCEMMMHPIDTRKKARLPETHGPTLAEWGRDILRRMIDHWPRFNPTLSSFREALMAGTKMDARGADQYGTLITAHHILLHDRDPLQSDIDRWVEILGPAYDAAIAGKEDNWQACLSHLLDASFDLWRNESVPSIRLLLYARFVKADGDRMSTANARKKLSEMGCSLTFTKGEPEYLEHAFLFVPNKHPGLSQLFRGTNWSSDATAAGKWHGLLEQAPVAILEKNTSAKVAGVTRYGHKIKLSEIMEFDEVDEKFVDREPGFNADQMPQEDIPF